ncbi:MAG: hypothetical protein K0Q72_2089, partial [Armatimonadetes bacterium]|nr:hypothetical protein [Armatimonadota bacterium]
ALYQRAGRRDEGASSSKVLLKPDTFPALRRFGYGMGPNASLTENPTGALEGTAAGFHAAVIHMWQDASILGNVEKGPVAGAFDDPPLVELTEDQVDSIIATLYGPVSTFELPVRDDEWKQVVLWSRRAHLIVEHALQKYPEWKGSKRRWSRNNNKLDLTGAEALADVKAKLAEAEPEYEKLVADFKKAEPKGVSDAVQEDVETLGRAIAGVKQSGWVDWVLARDLYISKDYLAVRSKRIVPLYTAQGKAMPADRIKPIQEKADELKSTIEQQASRWKFPAGKPRDAAIEARAASAVKAKFPGATIIKTALDGTDWTIVKNDLGLPRYRTRSVLVLTQIPGQKWPWLILGSFDQTYSGGGTYNPGGTFAPPYSVVRLQSAN